MTECAAVYADPMRANTLVGIAAPTPVQLRGRVASPNAVVSPITGQAAAIIQYYFFIPGKPQSFWSGQPPADTLLESGLLGEKLLFATHGGTVRINVRGLSFYGRGTNTPAMQLQQVPDAFETVLGIDRYNLLAQHGALHYRETLLPSGEPVRLKGVVAPMEGSGQYRQDAEAEFMLITEAEPPTLSADVAEFA